jgi:allantoinase
MKPTPPSYPRDLVGYGRSPPHARWPGRARVALQFVLNHEEGSENCVLDGDAHSETFLSEIIGAAAFPMRHMSMESLFEYGSRAGLWRVLRAFERHKLPLTVFASALALQRHPEALAAYRALGHEIAGHGLRWLSYQLVDEATERAHLAEAVALLTELTGGPPLGWYTGPPLLDGGGGQRPRTHGTAPRGAVYARLQRHALRDDAGVQFRHTVLRLSARCIRYALS